MSPLQGLDPVLLPSAATHASCQRLAEGGERREDYGAVPADDRD